MEKNQHQDFHVPVLCDEIVQWLVIFPARIYVDATLGGGGHAEAILKKLDAEGKLLAIDQDEDALRFARKRLKDFADQIQYAHSNFGQLEKILKEKRIETIQGILFDLGVSSYQLDAQDRGFSYRFDAPLDMRMNQNDPLTAYHIINEYSEKELSDIFWLYGEERFSRRIARRILKYRRSDEIKTTFDLADIVSGVIRQKDLNKSLSRIFQAIRIEINRELDVLRKGLDAGIRSLHSGGRIAVIAYHSLEDRIVKRTFQEWAKDCICPPEFPQCVCDKKSELKILTKKIVLPKKEEIRQNSRARSAKLRVGEKKA